MNAKEIINGIEKGDFDSNFKRVYVTDSEASQQKTRYIQAVNDFLATFDNHADDDLMIFSAPGRTEICGNHTDHNHGKVLAASINLDAIAVACKNGEKYARVKSKGFDMDIISLNELESDEREYGKSQSLLRGVVSRLKDLNFEIGGFDAFTTSQVFSGSGLSSSAAYEILLGSIVSGVFNDGKLDDVVNAQVAQYAENNFFGKPCGLMDQMASSVGSFVTIDFNDPAEPVIKKIGFDFSSCGHALCIVDTGGDHADLTDDYAAVRREMELVAEHLGKKVLRDVDFNAFVGAIPAIREKIGDRAVLRAFHFYNENKRVENAVKALENGNFDLFKNMLLQSGQSSFMFNQNVYSQKNVQEQGVSVALAMSQQILGDRGVCRVHGGGFAGTIQAFVPMDLLDTYKTQMEEVLGKGTCYVLSIRPVGGVQVI